MKPPPETFWALLGFTLLLFAYLGGMALIMAAA